MAHALKVQADGAIFWPRLLDLAMALTTNFAVWALILQVPHVLRQL